MYSRMHSARSKGKQLFLSVRSGLPKPYLQLRSGLATVQNIPCVLNGKSVVSSQKVPVFSHNGKIVQYYSPLDNIFEKIPHICDDSFAGFKQWSGKTGEQRRDVLLEAAKKIEKNSDLYIAAHKDIGGPDRFARFGVGGAVASCKEYASQITNPAGFNVQSNSAKLAITEKIPLGPVLAIAAWNAPTILWARAIMAPLAAGCSVIIKSSEKAPVAPFLLVQDLIAAGVPPKALQLIQCSPEENGKVVTKLLENAKVRKINFTGSTAVGKQIAVAAAQNLKPALLELGGKNVAVVLKDADLEKAAANIISSAWLHKGQVCMCVDSVYVNEVVYEPFLECLKRVAPKVAANPDLRLNQRDDAGAGKVHDLVNDAVDKGARVFFGKSTQNGPSNCSPVILTDVSSDSGIASEETFGPVFAVSKFDDLDAIVSQINSQPHGLKASVWGANVLSALEVARKLEFGGVHINDSTIHDEPTVPHGGVKESGSGRFNGAWGIDEFRYTKAITFAE